MKYIHIFLMLMISVVVMTGQKNIYPGMHINEFRKEIPNKIPSKLPYNETLTMEEEINGVKGKWTIQFKNYKLQSIRFRSESYYLGWPLNQEDEKNSKIAGQSSSDAKKVFKYYYEKYGEPDNKVTVEFRLDPNKANYSEILLTEQWELSGMKISVDYKFEGDSPEMMNMNNSDITMYQYVIEVNILPGKQGKDEHQEKFFIGMDIKDFAKNFPNLMPYGCLENGQSGFSEIIYDLDGEWYFDFINDSLDHYGYSVYFNEFEELTEENFIKCLTATEKLIEDYKGVYGEPTELDIGDKKFKDPGKEQHWGYDVIEAKWKDDKKLFRIDFAFHGGKGYYFYLVKIEAYKPGYKYFD